jgi:hypothetical protein
LQREKRIGGYAGDGGREHEESREALRVSMSRRVFPFALFGGALVVGLVLFLRGDAFGGDGTSYLDMGDGFFQGHRTAILNELWSPLYPFLLGLARWMFKPSMQWQPLVVDVTNLLIYGFTLSAFHYFWSRLLRMYQAGSESDGAAGFASFSDWQFWSLGYGVFLFMHLDDMTDTTPDLLLSGIVYLCCGLILATNLNGLKAYRFGVLGIVLGVGFLTKAIMLPLAPFFVASAVGAARPRRAAVGRSLITLFFFLAIAGPYVFALSRVNGRFTVGEAGALNYLWHVNRVPYVPYLGLVSSLGLGTPLSPVRQIWESPAAYQYESVSGVTYAPWYDPSKLMRGLHIHIDWKDQFTASAKNVRLLLSWLWYQRALAGGVVVLLAMRPPGRATLGKFLSQWFVWLPVAAAVSLYLLMWVEHRYLAQFLVVWWGAILALVRLPGAAGQGARLLSVGFAVILLMLVVHVADDFANDFVVGRQEAKTEMQIAKGLSANGVRPEDKIAVIDASAGEDWQKLLNLSVVAEIPGDEQNEFWSLSPERRAQMFHALARSGAKVLVAPNAPNWAPASGWIKLADGPAYMVRLSR